MATVRLGNNSNGYRLGNAVKTNAWLQRALGPATAWARLAGSSTGTVVGDDPQIAKAMDGGFSTASS